MYTITKDQWKKIPNDYKGISINDPKIKVVFGCFIPGYTGNSTNLLFEGKHFKIV